MTGGGDIDSKSCWKTGTLPSRKALTSSQPPSPVSGSQFLHHVQSIAGQRSNSVMACLSQLRIGISPQASTGNASYPSSVGVPSGSPNYPNNHANVTFNNPLTPPDETQGSSPSPPSESKGINASPNTIYSSATSVIVKQEAKSPERRSSSELSTYNSQETQLERAQNCFSNSSFDSSGSNNLDNLQDMVQRTACTEQQEELNRLWDSVSPPQPRPESEISLQPKRSGNAKTRTFKCKNCSFVASSKNELWRHKRVHIKKDKLLSCTECEFVTELKHHLEYHILNHKGMKPIKCDECDYRCVNKSMLSSHKKCHSTIHQYNCGDCQYASKYCHSLKVHLRNHRHRPGRVLNADGTENPYVVIDVYGSRRGPKMKQQLKKQLQQRPQHSPPTQQNLPMLPVPYMSPYHNTVSPPSSPPAQEIPIIALGNNLHRAVQAMSYATDPEEIQSLQRFIAETQAEIERRYNLSPFMFQDQARFFLQCQAQLGFNQAENNNEIRPDPTLLRFMQGRQDEVQRQISQGVPVQQNPLLLQELQRLVRQRQAELERAARAENHSSPPLDVNHSPPPREMEATDQNQTRDAEDAPMETCDESSPVDLRTRTRRRKGRAQKFIPDETPEDVTTMFSEVETVHNQDEDSTNSTVVVEQEQVDEVCKEAGNEITCQKEETNNNNNTNNKENTCEHCGIIYNDAALYTIHMGLHARGPHPFKCNICGKQCESKIEFHIHLMRPRHDHESDH